jgi:hypothetical protein
MLKKSITLLYDNLVTKHKVENPIFHERTKHIEIDCHLIRNKYLARILEFAYVKNEDQVVDVLTKPLQ